VAQVDRTIAENLHRSRAVLINRGHLADHAIGTLFCCSRGPRRNPPGFVVLALWNEMRLLTSKSGWLLFA
jgi:hypothetical protein